MRDDSAEILFQTFLRKTTVNSSSMDVQGCPLFDVVHLASFRLPTAASRILQGALKVRFGGRGGVRHARTEFPSLDSRQMMFLWAHKEVAPAPHQPLVLCSK